MASANYGRRPGAAWLVTCVACAGCGSADSGALYSSGSAAPWGAAGGAGGYVSGTLPPTGGGSIGGFGSGATGGFGGTGGASFPTGGSGGFTGGAGGFTGVGGTSATGGTSFGGAGGSSGAGGGTVDVPDAGFNPAACNYSGTWASYVRVPVSWPASIVLLAGSGYLQQWNLVHQEQAPGSFSSTVRTVPCSIFLPDLQSNFFQAGAKFGIRFPDSLFDAGLIPEVEFQTDAVIRPDGLGYLSPPFAILVGLALDDPTNAPWPTAANMNLKDHDGDNQVGVTVVGATGQGYSLPPGSANVFDPARADLLYITERTVSHLEGKFVSCDELSADVYIETVNGKSAIDSTVVGCHKTNGEQCTVDNAAFIDQNRPEFTATGPGKMSIVRMPEGATCADIRARFPMQ